MESYWPSVVKNPTGNKAVDEFAVLIQNIPKIVFSHTLTNVEWENAKLAKGGIKDEVVELKQKSGKDILVGSPSLIVALTKLKLIDSLVTPTGVIIANYRRAGKVKTGTMGT